MRKNILRVLFSFVIISMIFAGEGVLAASCGSANGQSYYNCSDYYLCASGTASTVSGSGPWTWTCYGWMPRESNRDWIDITMSSSGQYITAVVYGGQIYVSNDYGATWAARGITMSWQAVAMSSSGQYQIAGGERSVYRSTDYGVTWNLVKDTGDFSNVESLNVSPNGQYQIIGSMDNAFISSDYGATWTTIPPAHHGVAISDTGQYLIRIGTTGGTIKTSSDYGATWTDRNFLGSEIIYWRADMSSSGQYQATSVYPDGKIYTSSDYGVTWTARQFNGAWVDVEMSSSGQYQISAISGGQIYISSDYGVTWTAKETNRAWEGVAISADGQHKAAVVYGGQIYVSYNDDGSNANCSAMLKTDGVCGSAQGHGYPSTSNIDLSSERCASGTFTSFTDAGSTWTWSCNGINGGTNANCSAMKVAGGTAHGQTRRDEPTTNLCAYGTATTKTFVSNIWYWFCTNNPGDDFAAYTYKTTCGTANGGTYSSPPSTPSRTLRLWFCF